MKLYLVVSCLFLYLSVDLSCQTSEQIQKLEEKIKSLEKRIEILEKMINLKPSLPEPNETKWKNKSNWRELKIGMDFDQVRKLLGEPFKISGGAFTYWYYDKREYLAYVVFYNGIIHSWKEPE